MSFSLCKRFHSGVGNHLSPINSPILSRPFSSSGRNFLADKDGENKKGDSKPVDSKKSPKESPPKKEAGQELMDFVSEYLLKGKPNESPKGSSPAGSGRREGFITQVSQLGRNTSKFSNSSERSSSLEAKKPFIKGDAVKFQNALEKPVGLHLFDPESSCPQAVSAQKGPLEEQFSISLAVKLQAKRELDLKSQKLRISELLSLGDVSLPDNNISQGVLTEYPPGISVQEALIFAEERERDSLVELTNAFIHTLYNPDFYSDKFPFLKEEVLYGDPIEDHLNFDEVIAKHGPYEPQQEELLLSAAKILSKNPYYSGWQKQRFVNSLAAAAKEITHQPLPWDEFIEDAVEIPDSDDEEE